MSTATIAGLDNHERLDVADVRRRIKAIFIGSIGNPVDWYDFYAYSAFALYFAGAFFPSSDPVVYVTVALWFKSIGHEAWFHWYLTGMIGVSLMVYLFMRDTKADSAMHRHE
jgi:hypothetical protein